MFATTGDSSVSKLGNVHIVSVLRIKYSMMWNVGKLHTQQYGIASEKSRFINSYTVKPQMFLLFKYTIKCNTWGNTWYKYINIYIYIYI